VQAIFIALLKELPVLTKVGGSINISLLTERKPTTIYGSQSGPP